MVSHAKLTYIKIIAVLEVAAGVWGISINIYVFLRYLIRNLMLSNLVVNFLALIVNLMLLCAGMWLWANEDRGYHWSRILQAIQIPLLRTPLVTYQFISGMYSTIIIGQGVQFSFGFTHTGQFGLLESGPVFLGINLIPILALWCLRERIPTYEYLFGEEDK